MSEPAMTGQGANSDYYATTLFVNSILDVRHLIGDAEDPVRIGLVFGEEQQRFPLAVEIPLPQLGIDSLDDRVLRSSDDLVQQRAIGTALPGPLVAEPERRQDVQLGRLGA